MWLKEGEEETCETPATKIDKPALQLGLDFNP